MSRHNRTCDTRLAMLLESKPGDPLSSVVSFKLAGPTLLDLCLEKISRSKPALARVFIDGEEAWSWRP